jgi:hypothetical protein
VGYAPSYVPFHYGVFMLTVLFANGLSAFWKSLGMGSRLCCLVLLTASACCFFSSIRVMLRLHTLRTLKPAQHAASIQLSVAGLRALVGNVRQVIDGAFYLFGFVVFLNLQSIANVADSSKTPLGYFILQNFIFDCSFTAIGFLVLLVLHLSQWFTAGRVNAFEKHLNAG